MITQYHKLALTASLVLAMAFTLSCSSNDGDDGKDGDDTSGGSACPNAVTGSNTVSCGGQTYRTVVIDTQTWMAKNLNYNASGSRCYGDNTGGDSQNLCNTYGRLYNWATAMALPSNCNSTSCASRINPKHRGICPAGWHIPGADWNVLIKFVNPSCSDNSRDVLFCADAGTKLKSVDGWNPYDGIPTGTDELSFTALPGGYGDSDGSFNGVGNYGSWWSSSEGGADAAHYWKISDNEKGYLSWGNHYKSRLRSVRCVKDSL